MSTTLIVPVGLVHASVCSDEGAELAAEWLNRAHPTGVGGWRLSDASTFSDGQPNPCPCADDPARSHYLFEC